MIHHHNKHRFYSQLIRFVFFFIILTTLLQSCSTVIKHKKPSEGIIKYKITYLADESSNPLISLLPSHLLMHYKNNSVAMTVEGWMGIFKSSFIKKAETSEAITMLKMMNKRYYYKCLSSSDYLGMSGYENPVITFDEKTKTILGKTCQHATVLVDSGQVTFDIYYTTEISISEPNKHTLYEEIPGVLMEFQLEMNGIPMRLEASEILDTKVEDAVFEIPAEYEEVTKEKIDEIFKSLAS